MRILLTIAAAALVSGIAVAAPQADAPKETVIHWADNGGIRNWQAGPPSSGIVFLQDRNYKWYRVMLSGPCLTDTSLDTLTFKTDTTGTFDRFSKVMVGRYPDRSCGVTSIVASAPPPGQPPEKK